MMILKWIKHQKGLNAVHKFWSSSYLQQAITKNHYAPWETGKKMATTAWCRMVWSFEMVAWWSLWRVSTTCTGFWTSTSPMATKPWPQGCQIPSPWGSTSPTFWSLMRRPWSRPSAPTRGQPISVSWSTSPSLALTWNLMPETRFIWRYQTWPTSRTRPETCLVSTCYEVLDNCYCNETSKWDQIPSDQLERAGLHHWEVGEYREWYTMVSDGGFVNHLGKVAYSTWSLKKICPPLASLFWNNLQNEHLQSRQFNFIAMAILERKWREKFFGTNF